MSEHTAQSFSEFINTQLNKAQQKAVTHGNGSLLVIAGAGSGKTRVITARITDLILTRNTPAHTIVALTFTNKAANEMKQRIASFLGPDAHLPFIGTFHSYCVRLLRQNRNLLDIPFETILDTDDQQKIIKKILQTNGLHKRFSAKNISYQISQFKNKHLAPDAVLAQHNEPLLYEIYKAYEKEKQISKCLDFDDLLLCALKLFKHSVFKTLFHSRIRHVLIDEYQDTNIVQNELLKQMTLINGELTVDSVCAVGDEDQSIYSWRGATVTNIRNFPKVFPDTQTIHIEQNYRSIQPILDIANTVIQNNNTRSKKKLWSEKKGVNRIHALNFASEYQEAESIATALSLLQKENNLSSAAILYRTHAQSRALEEALIKHTIPYRIIGGMQFYNRMEIRDLLAYLKLIANPFDRISFSRIINVPSRKLGEKFEELFFATWNAEPFLNVFECAHKLINGNTLSTARQTSLQNFLEVFKDLSPTSKPTDTLQIIIKRSRYIRYLHNSYEKDEASERVANVDELMSALFHFEQQDTITVLQVLEEITLLQDRSAHTNAKHDAVLLMTLHAAKGLEFDTVFIPGLEEGLFPSSRATYDQEALEEERRLFYVGITRARERLLFTHAKYRYTYGQMTNQTPSRFLHELPQHLAPHSDRSFWETEEARLFYMQWFNSSVSIKTIHAAIPIKTNKTSMHDNTKHTSTVKKRWRKNQPIKHTKYGIGIVQKVEQRSNTTFVQIQFKSGLKKISEDFIVPI